MTNKPESGEGKTESCCDAAKENSPTAKPQEHSACCGGAAAGGSPSAGVADAFAAFVKASAASGAIDERTKGLITYALVVMARCRPCVKSHRKKALSMGITQAQLDEAAWCAVAMGGAPVRMFYLEAIAD